MILALRVLSCLAGLALAAAPSSLLLMFAHGVGEPPHPDDLGHFLLAPIGLGLVLGGGLLLVALPRLVAGARTPAARIVAGALIVLSAACVAFAGFSGSVTRITNPAILLIECAIFLVFIWPARTFQKAPPGHRGQTPW
jgi:hypothetical protein